MKAVELIQWARAFDKKVDAIRAEEARVEEAFRTALREERFDNEVDQAIRRMLVPWYFFGQPAPVIPVLDEETKYRKEELDEKKTPITVRDNFQHSFCHSKRKSSENTHPVCR